MASTHMEVVENGRIFAFGFPERTKMARLDAGMYQLWSTLRDRGFQKVEPKSDKLIELKKSVASDVVKDIELFLTEQVKKNFKEYEMLYRRGILMYGPPGTGKTSAIIEIARSFVKNQDGIVLLNPNPAQVGKWIRDYRDIDPGRTFLVVFEELETLIEQGFEPAILSLLDGQESVDNVIWLATTNYIKRIPDRIKKRPSRFARAIKVGAPSADIRKAFLNQRLLERHKKDVDIDKLVSQTDGFTIDHLKDLVLTMFCLGLSQKAAVDSIRKMLAVDDDEEE